MKKKILAFILSGCMFIQNSGLVLASELPLYTQVETEQGEAVETAIDEDGDSAESASSSEEDKEDTDSASETDEKGDTDSTADTEDKEDTDSSAESEDKEGADSSDETGDKEDNDSPTENGQEETDPSANLEDIENTDASSYSDTEENTDAEEASDSISAEDSEQNMTDVSDGFLMEEPEGSLSIEYDFAWEENEESNPNIQYAYAEQYYDTDEDTVSAQSMSNSNGVYFGYTVTDSKEHLGVLSEYISDESAIVLPHKLGNTYMTEVGEGVFADMDDKDQSDTSKLPSQSTTNRKLQSEGEKKILELINAARIKDGKRPLFVNNTLRQTARRKTLEMFNRNYFGHPNPDNVGTDEWLKKCGFPLNGSKYAENIAYKYECEDSVKLYNIWKNSKDDYNRMMNGDYRTVGIGVYTDEKGTIVGTMIMSSVIFQNITNVEIEFGYERIGSRAFENCRNLTTIKIPSTVSYIADDAFNGCSKLTIRGKADSYAQTYAESKGIKFKAVTEKSPIEKFGFDDEEIFLEVGDWDYAGVTIKPADYKHLVKITTEGNSIDYQADGTVHALAKGTTTITARVVDDEEICKIIVDDAPLIPMQSIGFLDKELVLYEGESIKPAIQIVPVNTTDTVQLSSSNEAVVKVDEDNTGEVIALKAGNAVLTVSGMDSNNAVRVSADINVRVVTDNNTIQVPGGIKAVTNISPTLAKVTLPDGYSWKEPQTKLKANDKDPVQSFVAQYNKGTILQDCIIPVSVSKVSGIVVSMDGKNLASSQKLSLLSRYELIPSVKSVGEEVDPAFFDVSYKVDKSAVMSVEKNTSGGRTSLILAPQASGKCSVTVEVKLKDENGRYYGASTKAYGTYKKKYTFQVVDAELISGITVELADENPEDENSEDEKLKGVSLLSDGSIQVDEDATKFQLHITGLDGDGKSKSASFKAKSNNKKIVKVSSVSGKNDVIEVSVKKAGKTSISITAQDKGKYTKNINVIVKRYSPQMNTKTLTLNKLKADVGAKINIVPANDNPISSGGMLLYEDKDTTKVSSLFDVRRISNTNSYEVVFRNGILSNVTKSSYKLFLKVITEEQGKEYVYPLTIKLKNTKPSVKLKQTSKINLFYKDVSSRLEIDSGTEKIADIYQVNEVYNKPHFHAEFTKDNDGEWSGIIEPQNVTGDNYKKVARTIELCFVYEDYVEEFSVVKKFTVNSTYKKISLVTADPQVYFYTKTDDNKSVFQIKEKGSKNVFNVGGEDGIDVELVNNVNKVEITLPEDDKQDENDKQKIVNRQDIGVELLGNKKKSLTAKLRVSHSNWRETLTCSLKLVVNKDIPSLVIDKNTVSFNSNAAGIEIYDIEAHASCNKEVKLVRLREADIVGTSSAAKKLFNEKKITISPKKNSNGNTRSLKVCLNASNVKGGTYSYKIYAWCIVQGKQSQQIQRMKPVTLNIKVVDKKPLASLSSKGKIDINDVKNTEIVYTPKLTNVTGNIKSASLKGEYASQFEIKQTKDGKCKIKLKEDSALKKGKYKLYFNFVLDNGIRVETKAFNIKL